MNMGKKEEINRKREENGRLKGGGERTKMLRKKG